MRFLVGLCPCAVPEGVGKLKIGFRFFLKTGIFVYSSFSLVAEGRKAETKSVFANQDISNPEYDLFFGFVCAASKISYIDFVDSVIEKDLFSIFFRADLVWD